MPKICVSPLLTLSVVAALFVAGCATAPRSQTQHPGREGRFIEAGIASWYGPGFHGRKTASGERFNQGALTCAHKTLPFHTRIRVTNLNNGEDVVVVVNDRGPFVAGRVVDLSKEAARRLGILHTGTAPVRLEIVPESYAMELE